jgi:hypothetical protein
MEGSPFRDWLTPHGPICARIYESYIGLRGQPRYGLVDRQGRVHHYDRADLFITNLYSVNVNLDFDDQATVRMRNCEDALHARTRARG